MPPPPPAPPPPPLMLFGGSGSSQSPKSSHAEPPVDRNALLSQIKKGARLKRVETNDRSTPLIDGGKASSGGNAGNANFKTNGPSPLIPPGGLFAQGMPKLRPTASRAGDLSERMFGHQGHKPSGNFTTLSNSSGALHLNEPGGSRSHPPSPASKLRQTSFLHNSLPDSSSNRNFPNDISIKGPAPVPPPANQKPNFNSPVSQVSNSGAANKHPGVRRSVSQTSIGPRVRPSRPPPNVRPPPPPKSAALLQGGPPPPPSKPPNVMRRQSFGVADMHSSHQLSLANNDVARLSGRSLVPPPPPRNNSAPNSLNQMQNSSPTTVHVNKMTTAPPPPPSRPGLRAPMMRPPPPPIRAPAPPPPPHRFSTHPAPPSQLKAMPSHNAAPPPPARVSSAMSSHAADPISDLEARFYHKFHSTQSFPHPEKYSNIYKMYPSKVQHIKQMTRRQPPPPPPSMSNGPANGLRGHTNPHQPVLHIQLESRVFANNTAHC